MQTQCWNPRPPGVEDLFPDTFEFRDVPLIQSFKDHLLVTLQAIRINSENLLSLKEALSLSVEQSSWVNSISKELGQQEMRMRVLIERTTGIMDAVSFLSSLLSRRHILIIIFV